MTTENTLILINAGKRAFSGDLRFQPSPTRFQIIRACHRPSLRSVSTGPKQVAQQARDNDANMAPSPDDPPPPAMYPGLWITFKGIFGNIGKHLGYILAAF